LQRRVLRVIDRRDVRSCVLSAKALERRYEGLARAKRPDDKRDGQPQEYEE
jgi:hypothetical protein